MTDLHPVLRRQLRRAELGPDAPPDAAGWRRLLTRLSDHYQDADADRYRVERAFALSSRETEELHRQLEERSRDALAVNRAIQRAALESMRDGMMITGLDARMLAVNESMVRMWDLPRELLQDGKPYAILGHVLAMVRDPAGLRAATEALLADPSASATYELHLLDGRVIERYSAPVRLSDGRIHARMSVYRDMTEERHNARFVTSLIENLPDMVFVKDARDLRFVAINRAGEELLGLSREAMIGKDDREFFSAEQAEHLQTVDRRVLQSGGQAELTRVPIQTRTRGRRILHTKKIPVPDEAGVPRYLLGISRDVTEQIEAEEALRAAKEAAERASRAKTQFLQNMSHEMRTPLNAVIGFAQVLRMRGVPEEQRGLLDHILSAGRHMLDLVNDLLDLRRIEAVGERIELDDHDVSSVVGTATTMVMPLIEERHHTFAVDCAAPRRVRCNMRSLLQVLLNLLSNAAKYTPHGGRIDLRVIDRGERVWFEVEDAGCGIAPEDAPMLFTYFMQAGAKHQHHMRGSGVGLALTKALVEQMGGVIEVTTEIGRGSLFRVGLQGAA